MDLDLVAGEVAQVGDDGGLFGMDRDHRLAVLKILLLVLPLPGATRALGEAGGGGQEGVRPVGDAHDGAPLPAGSTGGGEVRSC